MNQQHTSVTHGASTDLLASPEYTPKQNFSTSPKPNFSNVKSSDDKNREITKRNFRPRLGQNRGRKRGKQGFIAHVHNLAYEGLETGVRG
jgi:hypothetical protein